MLWTLMPLPLFHCTFLNKVFIPSKLKEKESKLHAVENPVTVQKQLHSANSPIIITLNNKIILAVTSLILSS